MAARETLLCRQHLAIGWAEVFLRNTGRSRDSLFRFVLASSFISMEAVSGMINGSWIKRSQEFHLCYPLHRLHSAGTSSWTRPPYLRVLPSNFFPSIILHTHTLPRYQQTRRVTLPIRCNILGNYVKNWDLSCSSSVFFVLFSLKTLNDSLTVYQLKGNSCLHHASMLIKHFIIQLMHNI